MHTYLSPWSRLHLFTLQDCIRWLLCYLVNCATLLSRLPITYVILLLLLPHYSVLHWYSVSYAFLLPLLLPMSYLCNFDCPITLLPVSPGYLSYPVTSVTLLPLLLCYFVTSVTLLLLLSRYFCYLVSSVTLLLLLPYYLCYLCYFVTSVTSLPCSLCYYVTSDVKYMK